MTRTKGKNENRGELIDALLELDPEMLHQLCEAFDDGELDDIFRNTLIPRDAVNYPDDYTVTRKKE